MLNSAQIVTLHNFLLTVPELQTSISNGDDVAIADYLNAPKAPNFIVWRTSVAPDEYLTAITWTEVDALTIGKARIWEWMTGNQLRNLNPSLPNIRQGLNDAFNIVAPTTRAALLAMAKRNATVLEALFATGTGTNPAPGNLVIEGNISYAEASGAR